MAQQPLERIQAISDAICNIQGKPLLLAPQLEDIDLLEIIRRHAKYPRDSEVIIVLNVDSLKPEEVKFGVYPKENKLTLIVEHGDHIDRMNRIFSRTMKYVWYLPEKISFKKLDAQWTADNYLIIISSMSDSGCIVETPYGKITLVPRQTDKNLRPPVDLSAMKNIVQDLKDKSEHTLNFVRMRLGDDVGSGVSSAPSSGPDKPDDKPHNSEFKKPADVASNTKDATLP